MRFHLSESELHTQGLLLGLCALAADRTQREKKGDGCKANQFAQQN